MTTPQPDTAAPSVISWYFGPVAWDQRPDAAWHAGCPDPYATGHDGEVWLDHHQGAFCTGCRHYEPGQAEQDIPPERAAELAEATQTTGTDLPASPDPVSATSSADATEEEAAATASNVAAAPSTPAEPPLEPAPAAAPPAATAGGTAAETAAATGSMTPTSTVTAAATAERPGILTRIKDALEGEEPK